MKSKKGLMTILCLGGLVIALFLATRAFPIATFTIWEEDGYGNTVAEAEFGEVPVLGYFPYWRSPIVYTVNGTEAPGGAQLFIDAVAEMAEVWANNAFVSFSYDGSYTPPNNSIAPDGRNSVVWSGPGDWLFDPNAVGIAWLTEELWPDRTMREGDIFINGSAGINWSYNPGLTEWDIKSVLAHELGHGIGLAHNTAPGATVDYQQWFEGVTSPRNLSGTDINSARRIYGPNSYLSSNGLLHLPRSLRAVARLSIAGAMISFARSICPSLSPFSA